MCATEILVFIEDLSGDLDGGREWRVARSISHVQGGKVPLRLCNPHTFAITLPQRRALATVSQIESQEFQAPAQLEVQFMGPQEVEVGVSRVAAATARQPMDPTERQGTHPVLQLQGEGLNPEEQRRLTVFLDK